MGKRNALSLGSDDVVIFGGTLQQLTGTGNGQFLVAENDKTGNVQLSVTGQMGR